MGRAVDLIGAGASVSALAPMIDIPVLQVGNGADVYVSGLTFRGAAGSDFADGITCNGASLHVDRIRITNNDGAGIDSRDCTLRVERSYLSSNSLGGLRTVDGEFVIRNNFIVNNGNSFTGLFGGVMINVFSPQSVQVFDFNTVARNLAPSSASSTSLSCSTITPMVGVGNIIVEGLGGGGNNVSLAGCELNYSNVEGMVGGEGNIDMSVSFADASNADFHLLESSPGIDVPGLVSPDCNGTCVDYDGESRPYNGRYDMGADEYVP